MKRVYKTAPLGGSILYTTTVFLALPPALLLFGSLAEVWDRIPAFVLAAICAIAVAYSWFGKPLAYELTDTYVKILYRRPFRNIVIPLSELGAIERVDMPMLAVNDALGVGFLGIFSASAQFWSRKLGRFQAAVTNSQYAVLLGCRRKYVISPEDPDAFVEDVMTRLEAKLPA